jgi:hypothetical protein
MFWFRSSEEVIWRAFSQEIGAEFVEGGFWKRNKVQVQAKPWTLTLDLCLSHKDENQTWRTRLRAPYVNPDGIRFRITRKSGFSALGKILGMQHIELGDPVFDMAFYLQGNNEDRVRALFDCPRIRQMLQAQPQMHLEVKDNGGWFGPKFPEDVDVLRFDEDGAITDKERLKALFDLFAAVLGRLCEIGAAQKEAPEVML